MSTSQRSLKDVSNRESTSLSKDFTDVMEERLLRFLNVGSSEVLQFDPIKFIYETSKMAKDLYVCERNTECVRQDDDYIKVERHAFDICSNCSFTCNYAGGYNIGARNSLRFFVFTEEEEIPLFDVGKETITFHVDTDLGSSVSFNTLEQERTDLGFALRFDYMSFH